MDRLELRGSVRVVSEEKGIVDLVAATDGVARDNALIEPAGWELDNFRSNPVMLWSHDALSLPVARAVDLKVTEDALTARAEFDQDDPEAMRLFGKIQRGFVNATSVRWKPIETRIDLIDGKEVIVFVRQELLEISFVSVPTDPKSLVMRADTGDPISVEDYRPAEEEEPEVSEPDGRLAAVENTLADYLEARASRPSVEDMLITKVIEVTGTNEAKARELIAAAKE